MNILILSWRGVGHPNAGGAEIVTHEHARRWVRAGHQVTLFTSAYKGGKSEEIIDGVVFKRSGHYALGVHFNAFLWYVFENKVKYDLVIDQFHGIPYFTPLYVRSKKLAFIHEVTKDVWRLNPWPKPLYWIPAILGPLGEKWIFRFLYRRLPFMTVSFSTKTELIEWGIPADNIVVVYNGVIIDYPNPIPEKEDTPTIIFLGALARDKGIEDAIKFFSLLKKKGGRYNFWVVGKGESQYVKKIKDICKKEEVIKDVKLWGFVTQKDKFKLLARSHILINPSYREGWGLVNIEANSMGTPVVGYRTHGTKDSVKHKKTGLLVKLGDIQGLADAVNLLMTDQKLYQLLREQAYVWSKRFNWEKQSSRSLKMIENIVKH